jgi:hypothetical protein
LEPSSGCRLTNPVFLRQSDRIAAVRTCHATARRAASDQVLVFNLSDGKPVALVASAPAGGVIQGLSVDPSGQHFLLGLVTVAGAENVQIEKGRFVPISHHSPTDAEW